MAKDGFKCITIRDELYERLDQQGGPSIFAQVLMKKALKEREQLHTIMKKVTVTPEIVKVYL